MPAPLAKIVACASCGGSIELRRVVASGECPYCRQPWRFSAAELGELKRYERDVRMELSRANDSLRNAAHWDYWFGGADARRRNHPLVGVGVAAAIMAPLVVLACLARYLELDPKTVGTLMPPLVVGILVVVLGGYFYWYFADRRDPRRHVVTRAAWVPCPQCGAPQTLAPGEVLRRCTYCGASLVPEASAMHHGRAQAEQAAFTAELERHRAERRGMAGLSRISLNNGVPYIALGSFLPLTLFGAVYGAIDVLSRPRVTDAHVVLATSLSAMALVNVGLIAAVMAVRRARRERWEGLVRLLVVRFGGIALRNLDGVVAWMDEHWAGAVEHKRLLAGPCFVASAHDLDGYPVQVVANPVGASHAGEGYVDIRVGAWIQSPETVLGSPRASAARAAFGRSGFDLKIERAGLTLHANAKRAKNLWKVSESSIACALVSEIVREAREVGATPVRGQRPSPYARAT